MNPGKPKNSKKGTKTDKTNAKNSGSAGTSVPKQSEKVKQLQDEITDLKAQLNIYRYNIDPTQLEEKKGISEESLVNMLKKENTQLRTELAKCTSENTVKSNDKELREKLEKSEKEKKKQALEISQKDIEITKLKKEIQEMESLESVRKKEIAQNRQNSSPSQNARHELDVDIGKNDKCELQEKQSDINKLEKDIKQLKNDNDDLKQKLFQYENKNKEEENNSKFESEAQKHDNGILKQHASEIAKMEETIKGLNEDLQTAKQSVRESENTIHTFTKETENLRNQIQMLQTESSNLRESMKQQTETLNAETERIKTEKKKIENDCSRLREQLKVKETQVEAMKTSSANTDISTKTADELQKKIDELNEFKNKLTDAESNIQSLKREKESLERNLHQEKNQRAENEQKIEKVKEEHKKLIDGKDETIKKLRKEKTFDQTKNSGSLEEKFKNAQEEIDELKNRLSKVVGANIMNDNPNITDLSDENRPTKLSEKFSELYDNEWTDAYEEAENEFKTEEKGIAHLYKTLLDVFEFCKKKSEEHAKHIRDSVMTLPNAQKVRPKSAAIGVTNQRQLKEVRKSFAPMLIESVFQNYVSEKKLNFTKKENTGKFIKKCVEICWLMNSQDPPVILDTSVVDGKSFDVDKFRTYTKTGKLVDYVVWPPMLLHKGGPMLCKGVAQGK